MRRLSGVDISVTGVRANVSVYVQRDAKWVVVGSVTNVTGTAVSVTVRTSVLVTVDANGVGMLVTVAGGQLLTSSVGEQGTAAGDGVYAIGDVGFVGGLRSVPSCATFSATTGRSATAQVVVPLPSTATSVVGWDPSTVAFAQVSMYMIPSASPKLLLPRILPGMLAISNAQYTALTFVIRNFYMSEGSPDPTKPYWNQLRMAIATALNKQDPTLVAASSDEVEARRRVSLALALDYSYSAPQDMPVGVFTTIPSLPSSLVAAIEEKINAFLDGRQQINTAFATNTTYASVVSGAVAQRVDVLVYAQPDADLTIVRELVRDEYQAYALASGDVSDIITIGEVYTTVGGTFLKPPAVSKRPLIVEAAISSIWVAIMAYTSFYMRRSRRGLSDSGWYVVPAPR